MKTFVLKVDLQWLYVECRKKEKAQQMIQLNENDYISKNDTVSTDNLVATSDLKDGDTPSPDKISQKSL